MIFPREQTLKNSRPTSAPFFAGWLSRPVMARRESNFWRFAESQCELGLQDLRTRITKRITRVAPGASSPDVHPTSCRLLLSLSGQHAADTRTRQRVFWRATSGESVSGIVDTSPPPAGCGHPQTGSLAANMQPISSGYANLSIKEGIESISAARKQGRACSHSLGSRNLPTINRITELTPASRLARG